MEGGRGYCICDIEAHLTRNLCEFIFYFYDEICGIPENVPRFLKNAIPIPEERHYGLASLQTTKDVTHGGEGMLNNMLFIFAISSRKESEPKSDGTIDHLPPSRQVSSDSQVSLKDVVRRYPRVSEIIIPAFFYRKKGYINSIPRSVRHPSVCASEHHVSCKCISS